MPSRSSLNASLTPELTAYVAAQVASGRYRSASEVLRAGLRLLQRDEPIGAVSQRSATHSRADGLGPPDRGRP